MNKPVLHTVCNGVSMDVLWSMSQQTYGLHMEHEQQCRWVDLNIIPCELPFSVNNTSLKLKVTPFKSKGTDIVGIYKNGLPYKLVAFRLCDHTCVSVSDTALV